MASSENSCIPSSLRVGFIGAGRMAQALSSGFIKSGLVTGERMLASDVDAGMLEFIKKGGIPVTTSNTEIVSRSDVIIIAVKPHIVPIILKEVASISADKLFVSIAAGVTIDSIQELLPESSRVIRVMPNTPALVSCGASVVAPGRAASQTDVAVVTELFSSIGICESLAESYLDAVTGLSGSGPAYGFLAIEALADGGVKMGLPRHVALKLAAQTLMGAAKMALDTGKHPGELKDNVCSPGGTTIAGVHALEAGGFRAALMDAVQAATNRSKQLAGKL